VDCACPLFEFYMHNQTENSLPLVNHSTMQCNTALRLSGNGNGLALCKSVFNFLCHPHGSPCSSQRAFYQKHTGCKPYNNEVYDVRKYPLISIHNIRTAYQYPMASMQPIMFSLCSPSLPSVWAAWTTDCSVLRPFILAQCAFLSPTPIIKWIMKKTLLNDFTKLQWQIISRLTSV